MVDGTHETTAFDQLQPLASHATPDVDVRPEGVTTRTCSRADGALSRKDADLAVAVSGAARGIGLRPDPSVLQVVGIAVAQHADVDIAGWSDVEA